MPTCADKCTITTSTSELPYEMGSFILFPPLFKMRLWQDDVSGALNMVELHLSLGPSESEASAFSVSLILSQRETSRDRVQLK